MTGPGRRFDPAEVDGLVDGDDVQLARDLERYAAVTGREPGADFVDRVMAAVADEPIPSPGVRRWTPAGILAAFGGAWQIAVTGGRPMAIRAQAMALVLIVAIGVAALGTATVVGVGSLLTPDASPSPSPSVEPSVAPTAVAVGLADAVRVTVTVADSLAVAVRRADRDRQPDRDG